ncbi:hypothetical protein WJX72_004949 [[Myrmecia] bisecta]|uniref:Molecular chaperone DnaK n=1 Tax=[Myrmecia] bisecta TaxID=41462 RepID=A0AAW1PNB7_9CHLO
MGWESACLPQKGTFNLGVYVCYQIEPLLDQRSTVWARASNGSGGHQLQEHGVAVPKPRETVVGIDLGTTNSAVAVIEAGQPVVVRTQTGARTLPSIVAYLPDGVTLVGNPAKRQAVKNPGNTFYSVKRFIGQDYKAAAEEAQRVAFTVASDKDGAAVVKCDHAEAGSLYPEEVSAHVVAQLLEAAERYTDSAVKKAVISVPAYFDDDQRKATLMAGKLAGLETVKLIREPVAAALAYGLNTAEDQTVLVFDLGGGTFDVSILEVGSGVIEVLATGGDAHLGGDDWDDALIKWLAHNHLTPAGVDWRAPPVLTQLKAIAEAAKIQLSESERVAFNMPFGSEGLRAVLTRQELEKMTAPLFRRARLPLDQACWQAGVDLGTVLEDFAARKGKSRKQGGSRGRGALGGGVQIRPKRRDPIQQVLLVGGATRMPAVRAFVKNMTGLEPKEAVVNPDEAVALGAAVQAGILEGSISDMMVLDVWQATLMRALATQKLIEQRQEEGAEVTSEMVSAGWASDSEETDAHDSNGDKMQEVESLDELQKLLEVPAVLGAPKTSRVRLN